MDRYQVKLELTNVEKPYTLFCVETGEVKGRFASENEAHEAGFHANYLADLERLPDYWRIPCASEFDEPAYH